MQSQRIGAGVAAAFHGGAGSRVQLRAQSERHGFVGGVAHQTVPEAQLVAFVFQEFVEPSERVEVSIAPVLAHDRLQHSARERSAEYRGVTQQPARGGIERVDPRGQRRFERQRHGIE